MWKQSAAIPSNPNIAGRSTLPVQQQQQHQQQQRQQEQQASLGNPRPIGAQASKAPASSSTAHLRNKPMPGQRLLHAQTKTQTQAQFPPELTDEQKEEIKEAFKMFDLDKDGKLGFKEFKTACVALGFSNIDEELQSALTAYDRHIPKAPGQKGMLLTLANFHDFIGPRIASRVPADEVSRAFDLFDVNGNGFITGQDLRRVADELGERSITDEEIASMIGEFDYDQDGAITLDDFMDICLS